MGVSGEAEPLQGRSGSSAIGRETERAAEVYSLLIAGWNGPLTVTVCPGH